MIKAVLDTNVLVSALIMRGHDGLSDQIIRRVEAFWLIYLKLRRLKTTRAIIESWLAR